MGITAEKLKELLPNLLVDNKDEEYIENLREYYDSIVFLSGEHKNLEFNNRDKNHASLVMSFLFTNAQDGIRIFANNFNGDICDTTLYLDSLGGAIERNIPISVCFAQEPNESSECFKMLQEQKKKGKDISIKKVSDEYLDQLKKSVGTPANFTVVDHNKFRYETDTELYKAHCNFDDKVSASVLNRNFDLLATNAITI